MEDGYSPLAARSYWTSTPSLFVIRTVDELILCAHLSAQYLLRELGAEHAHAPMRG